MELTNFSFLTAKNQHSTSLALKNQSMARLANGNRLNAPGVDSGALAVSMNLNSKQKVLSGKMTNIQNTISYLKTQEGAINSAMKIIARIAQVKTLALSPTLSDEDKRSYNAEFIELSDQLNSLKQRSFNKISLFSEVETGGGLFTASTESSNFSTENGLSASISRHVVDFEDLRYITEAGDAAKRGFGGIDVAYFPATESQKQVETITIGGNVAHGDEFRFSVKELSALLETESDTEYYHLANSDNEDPEFVRDSLFDKLTGDANAMKFLDVKKVNNDSFTITAKMKGDPYEIHSFGSTGSTGAMEQSTNVNGTLNDAQEDTMQINLGSASLFSGDVVSLTIEGEAISYTATLADQANDAATTNPTWAESHLADQIANEINGNTAIKSKVRAVANHKMIGGTLQPSPGSILIHSKTRGTPFTSSGQTLTLSSVNNASASISLLTTSPNAVGVEKEVSVKIGPDDNSPGGGDIAIGDVYRIRITERHPDDIASRYNFFYDGSQDYSMTVTSANTTHDDIRNTLINEINNRTANELNRCFKAVAGASGELIISERNAGDTFAVDLFVQTRDSLSRSQDVPNVSPFSIESSMNFLSAMLAQNGAEQSRLNLAHGNLQNHYAFGEQALSRISDSDTAREATRLARSSLKMNMTEQVMSKSARLKDILIPLTTDHHRGAVLSSTL